MIDIKPPENPWDEFWNRVKEETDEGKVMVPINNTDEKIAKELHAINNTLKDILKEMRNRKV